MDSEDGRAMARRRWAGPKVRAAVAELTARMPDLTAEERRELAEQLEAITAAARDQQ